MRSAWAREDVDIKEAVVDQFAKAKATAPILKRSSYNVEIGDSDGYDSDATQNTEGT